MPELPEVETVCRGLRKHIIGRTIRACRVRSADVLHQKEMTAAGFVNALTGEKFRAVERRGKYIVLVLEGLWLVCHQRMTGKMLVRPSGVVLGRHDHVVFELDDGQWLIYEDVRRFGGFSLWQESPYAQPPLSLLGPEPLTDAFNAAYLWESTRRRKRPVKVHILDQAVIAGIGNIYADEILFRAGVRPRKSAARLSKKECAAIMSQTKAVLSEAIKAGGSTIRDYVDSEAKAGSFQLAHQVYGRAGKPCLVCGTTLKSVDIGGRKSVYCPHCQKN